MSTLAQLAEIQARLNAIAQPQTESIELLADDKVWVPPVHEEVGPFDPEYDELLLHIEQLKDTAPAIAEEIPKTVEEPEAETVVVTEIHNEIKKLELENKELAESVDEPVTLLTVPKDPQEKLEALKANNKILTDALNNEADEHDEPVKPKYGKFNGPIIMVHIEGRPEPVWIDVDGQNIDVQNEKIAITPELKERLKEVGRTRAAEFLVQSSLPVEQHKHYAMTKEEYELEIEKEFPVLPLPKQAGPEWKDSILYGLSGDIIRKASQYCESHPAGMLVDFLVSFGSMVGRGPYFNIGATRHYTNEFMCRVGDSSKSRKGTGRDAIDEVLKLADPGWYADRIESGFGSGEAIINRVRDTTTEMHRAKGGVFTQEIVPGVDDKRLCIREGEIASVFVLAGKRESRADIIIRDGWDGKTLRNIVKGKSKDGFSNSTKCEEPHLSISGDTTISELRMKMPEGADENGFGNRFIYVYVYKTKDCPQGGPDIDWGKEIMSLVEVLAFAKTVKHVSMTSSARNWWSKKYSEFENQGLEGLAGKMTARAAAHIRRLAMIYALLDQADTINLDHFHFAKKLWDYCQDSATFIFGGITGNEVRLLSWIGLQGEVTFKQVYADFYSKHKLVGQIKSELNTLVDKKVLAFDGTNYRKIG